MEFNRTWRRQDQQDMEGNGRYTEDLHWRATREGSRGVRLGGYSRPLAQRREILIDSNHFLMPSCQHQHAPSPAAERKTKARVPVKASSRGIRHLVRKNDMPPDKGKVRNGPVDV